MAGVGAAAVAASGDVACVAAGEAAGVGGCASGEESRRFDEAGRPPGLARLKGVLKERRVGRAMRLAGEAAEEGEAPASAVCSGRAGPARRGEAMGRTEELALPPLVSEPGRRPRAGEKVWRPSEGDTIEGGTKGAALAAGAAGEEEEVVVVVFVVGEEAEGGRPRWRLGAEVGVGLLGTSGCPLSCSCSSSYASSSAEGALRLLPGVGEGVGRALVSFMAASIICWARRRAAGEMVTARPPAVWKPPPLPPVGTAEAAVDSRWARAVSSSWEFSTSAISRRARALAAAETVTLRPLAV